MTTEVFVHLVVMVLLVATAWLLPLLTPRTVPFGVRVPDDRVADPVVLREIGRYRAWVLTGGVLITLAGGALVLAVGTLADLVAVVLLLGGWYAAYYRANRAITAMKSEQNWFGGLRQSVSADTTLRSEPPRFPWEWAALPVVVVAATVVAGVLRYPSLPAVMAVHYGPNGADRFAPKSVGSVFTLVFIQAALTVLLLGISFAAFRARADIDPARPTASAHWHRENVVRLSRALLVLTTLVDFGMGATAWLIWSGSPSPAGVLATALVPVLVGVAVLIFAVYQGRQTQPAGEGGGSAHRDDDSYWRGGVFYINREDRSWFVPRRFGVGWTVNLGNPSAVITSIVSVAAIVLLGVFVPLMLR